MEATTINARDGQGTTAQTIPLTLLSHRDHTQRQVYAYPQQTVGQLLEQLLQQLAEGGNAEHMARMRECYEPVLEIVCDGKGIALDNEQSLEETGVCAGDTLQIAAQPRKEKLLFCRYSN